LDLERRNLDVFQNPIQRDRLSVYQEYARRINRRGGSFPFALPGDPRSGWFDRGDGPFRLPFERVPLGALPGYSPTGISPFSSQQRRAFATYGGFENRRSFSEPGDVATALGRRRALIAATALNAPVYRALSDPGLPRVPDPMSSVRVQALSETADHSSTTTLAQRLRFGAERSFHESLGEAWARFSEGRYRLAIRYFQTASRLRPDLPEPRIGEMFARVSIGSFGSAVQVMEAYLRRMADPFQVALDVSRRFRDGQEVLRVRLDSQMVASGDADAPARAMHALLLWYLNEREEARGVAAQLAREAPASSFAAWPALMRASADLPSPPTAP
jgi:hypothetical protein